MEPQSDSTVSPSLSKRAPILAIDADGERDEDDDQAEEGVDEDELLIDFIGEEGDQLSQDGVEDEVRC